MSGLRSCLVALLFSAAAASAGPADLEPVPAGEWTRAHAAHLLARAGFGGTPEEVERLARLTPEAAVAFVLDYERHTAIPPLVLDPTGTEDPTVDPMILARIGRAREAIRRELARQAERTLEEALRQEPGARVPAPPSAVPERGRREGPYTLEQIREYLERQAENRAIGELAGEVQRRWLFQLRTDWLVRMARTRRPLEERMTLFWHGHFATSVDVVTSPQTMKAQLELFRAHATGSFEALVGGVAKDPAMLRYLDGDRNSKARPNENFARELLELFTVGLGRYTEGDVKAAARAFTGWTTRGDGRFYYDRAQHDYGAKTFLGRTGPWNGDDILSILFEGQAPSRFISRKLARHFLGRDPGPDLAEELARTLFRHRHGVKPMLRQLFLSRAFYRPEVVGSRIKGPVELVVGLVRQLGLPDEALALASNLMPRMGQALLQPPSVKGWDEGESWINTSTLLSRYNLLPDLVGAGQSLVKNAQALELRALYLPRSVRDQPAFGWDMPALSSLSIVRALETAATPAEAVERLAGLLLARPILPARKSELAKMLEAPGQAFDPQTEATRRRLLVLVMLLTATPEYQLS